MMREVFVRFCKIVMMMCLASGLLAGCGSEDVDSDTGVEGQRIASSMQDYVQLVLDFDQKARNGQIQGAPMGDRQVAILERALENGGRVSRTDYEQAWASYRQCVVNKGYTAPPIMKVGEFYQAQWSMASVEGQEAREEKLREDDMACGMAEMLNVNEVYQRQNSNPNLYRNPSEGVVDCLHRNNLVKTAYTAKDYDEENRRFDKYWNDRRMGRAPTIAETHGHFSFDYSNVDAATCLANNHEAMDVQEYKPPEWKPFG